MNLEEHLAYLKKKYTPCDKRKIALSRFSHKDRNIILSNPHAKYRWDNYRYDGMTYEMALDKWLYLKKNYFYSDAVAEKYKPNHRDFKSLK